MISARKLIEWFYYMYNNNWGYIWGKSGQKWTQAMQDKATNSMAIKYGKKWIGHYVADCSGAFVFAYKKEGGKIYHGSNTIFKKYCSSTGKLKKGAREDGEEIRPGTAVFLLKDGNRHHIGLYVGNNLCIEAKGTPYGVVTSALSHWDEWGELKDVDYSDAEEGLSTITIDTRRTLRIACKGEDVKGLQNALNKWLEEVSAKDTVGSNLVPKLDVDGIFGRKTEAAVKLFQCYKEIKADGIVGPQTYSKLEEYYV